MRRISVKKGFVSVLLVLSLMFLLAASVMAHGKFVKSEPAPDSVLTVAPKEVRIWFNEELDTKDSNVKVFNAAGAQVDLGNSKVNLEDRKQIAVGLQPVLPNGVYTVKWHAVTDDDKGITEGEFKFTVNAPTPTPPPTAVPTATVIAPTPTLPPTLTPTATSAPPSPTPVPATATPTRVVPTPTPSPSGRGTGGEGTPATGFDPALVLMALSVVVLGAGAFVVLRRK